MRGAHNPAHNVLKMISMIELSRSRKANVLAFIAILGFFGALGLVWKASQETAGAAGISALATGNGTTYFVAGGTLYVSRDDGTLRDRIPLQSLGLGPGVSQLVPLDDALLTADGGSGEIQRCMLSQRRCTRVARIPMRGRGGTLALAAVPELDRLYVGDSSSHQLHVYTLSGRHLYQLEIEGGLKYPNEVLWLGDDRLLVVDTNHHRILIVRDDGAGRSTVLRKTAVKNDLGHGNTWPTAAAHDREGNTWVINSDGMLRNGELIVYDAAGRPQRRIDLGDEADPIVLAATEDTVLVADFDNYRLQQVGLDEGRVEGFGDTAVEAVLQDLRARRAYAERLHNMGVGLLVLFGLIGAAAGYFDWQARRALASTVVPPSAARGDFENPARAVLDAALRFGARPDARGIVWLHAAPKTVRNLKLVAALCVMLLGAAMVPMFQLVEAFPTRLIALSGGLTLAMLGLVVGMLHGLRRLRIGTDGRFLHVVDLFGRTGRGLPEDFLHTGRRLVLGRIAVPVPNPRQSMFDREAFAAVIEPMLAATPRSNEMEFFLRNLRQGDLLTWAGVAAVVALIALRVWLDV